MRDDDCAMKFETSEEKARKAEERDTKLKEIRKAVKEYDKHENDPYAYYYEEIDAVRNIRQKAREYIGFLLELVGTS